MAKRARVNPHDRGTPENLLYQRWRLSNARADALDRDAQRIRVEADAERAKADHYAKALEALGSPPNGQKMLEGPKL